MKSIMAKIIALASVTGMVILLSGCTCPSHGPEHHAKHTQYQQTQHKKHKPQNQITETVVFYQTYDVNDVDNVTANVFTRSSRGGESAMGTVKFKETNDGLKMKVDLIDLRPGKTYTAHVYQCGACNDSVCCDTAPMAIDLPTLRIDKPGRLQKSYIIRGLTATQLNNAQIVLTRDGGYKAAWGTLK